MLNHLGLLGLVIALVLFSVYIRVLMRIFNYVGDKLRKFMTYLNKLILK